MKLARHLLVALLLLLAQGVALTHAVEHLRPDADAPLTHSCALCLAAQGLDAALASAPAALALCAAEFAAPASAALPVYSPPAISPRARAPPAA